MINRVFYWLFFPYLITVLFAMMLGREKTFEIMGKNLLEEYLILLFFYFIFDIQRILINKLTK